MKKGVLFTLADDYGLCPEVDAGILETVRAGLVTSVDVLVNPDYRCDYPGLCRSGAAVGLHLNLTFGRPCVRGGVLAGLPGGGGGFISRPEVLLAGLDLAAAAREWRGQLACFRRLTGREPAHLSVHKHLHGRHRGLLELCADLARECRAPLRALDAGMRDWCRHRGCLANDHFLGDVSPDPYWTLDRLAGQLAALPPGGVTELMCHPGRGARDVAGLWYLAQRDTERETFCSAGARALLGRFELVPCRREFFRRPGDRPSLQGSPGGAGCSRSGGR